MLDIALAGKAITTVDLLSRSSTFVCVCVCVVTFQRNIYCYTAQLSAVPKDNHTLTAISVQSFEPRIYRKKCMLISNYYTTGQKLTIKIAVRPAEVFKQTTAHKRISKATNPTQTPQHNFNIERLFW
jgi:hypothetical protein